MKHRLQALLMALGLSVGLSVGLSIVFASGTRAADLDNAAIVKAFAQAALGSEERGVGQLYRWKDDVSVRFVGRAALAHHAWAEEQLAELSAVMGRKVERIDGIGAQILLVFVPSFNDVTDGRYNELLDRFAINAERRDYLLQSYKQSDAVCAGQVNARGSNLIGGIVFIPRDQLAPVIRSCISAQLTRVMGLPFAADEGAASALAVGSPHSHLTELDRLMLRLLYDPRMKSGMNAKNAQTIANSVLPSIRASAAQ